MTKKVKQEVVKTPGWRGRLLKVMAEHRRQPFKWGSHDCGIFAADCVKAMTGADFAEPYRGTYDTEEGAKKQLRRLGKGSHVHIVEELFKEIAPIEATTGDIAVVDGGEGIQSLGIVNGDTIAVYGIRGIGFVSPASVVRAFRVEGQ